MFAVTVLALEGLLGLPQSNDAETSLAHMLFRVATQTNVLFKISQSWASAIAHL